MLKTDKIYVAGHNGLVGSALVHALARNGFSNLLLRTHAELDLTDQAAVRRFFETERPHQVFLGAAKVGGIGANSSLPADFIRQNTSIAVNVIPEAHRCGVQRLMFFGSSCLYPRLAPQPIREEHLLTGPLEPTNRPNAVAKIAAIEMCWAYNRQHGTGFLSVMPTNLYGPQDNYDLDRSHVLPALLRKIHEAKVSGSARVVLWGTGSPRREFLHSDDMAEACLLLMTLPEDRFRALLGDGEAHPLINIGCGDDLTIRELAEIVAEVTGFRGDIVFDPSYPDGTPRKLLDISRLARLGWKPRIPLRQGIALAYEDMLVRQAAHAGG